jgi:hypothetical protein
MSHLNQQFWKQKYFSQIHSMTNDKKAEIKLYMGSDMLELHKLMNTL